MGTGYQALGATHPHIFLCLTVHPSLGRSSANTLPLPLQNGTSCYRTYTRTRTRHGRASVPAAWGPMTALHGEKAAVEILGLGDWDSVPTPPRCCRMGTAHPKCDSHPTLKPPHRLALPRCSMGHG